MLHDSERNIKYFDALRDAIKLMHRKGKPALVLDIGTGILCKHLILLYIWCSIP